MEEARPWLQHYPKEIPSSINYTEKSLHSFLIDSGTKLKEKKALHFMRKELTYGEVLGQAKQMANYLQSKGLKKGDRVANMLPNGPQSVITYYGALMAGGVVEIGR